MHCEPPVDRGHFAYTWTPLKPDEAASADATLRAVASAVGFTITGEKRMGSRQVLQAKFGGEGWSGARVEFLTDSSIGLASVSAKFPSDANGSGNFDPVVCAVLETAFPTGEDLAAMPGLLNGNGNGKGTVDPQTKALVQRRYEEDIDWVYARALQAGKSIVVVPVLNVDTKYAGKAATEQREELWADLSSTTRWKLGGEAGTLAVGQRTDAYHSGVFGAHHSFVLDNSRFLVYVVEPGKYQLDGTSIELKKLAAPTVRPADKPLPGRIGTAYLEASKYPDYYHEQAWRNATFANRQVSTNYCSLAIGGGPCVQLSTLNRTVTDQVTQGGYYEAVREYDADLLSVDTKLGKSFASFEVKPGEAVVVDGFYAQHPSLAYDADHCAPEGRGVRCDMTELVLVRMPAKAADLASRGAMSITEKAPKLREIFSHATYRALDVSAKGDALVPGLGQLYGIKR